MIPILLAAMVLAEPLTNTAIASEATAVEADSVPDDEESRRALTVQALLWVLLGIVLLGGVVMVGILLYGGHARRVARTPLPNQSPDDPFWYLRKGDSPGEHEADAGESSDDEAPPDAHA